MAEQERGIAVGNAGLILLAPFLPAYFDRLDLFAPDEGRRRWASSEAQARAVLLVQYLADGCTNRDDMALALNKLLCGQDLATPALESIVASEAEIEVADSLLQAVIANWPALGGTSVESLRETFLQREGMLDRTEAGWRLCVERKTVDILLDQAPWSFSVVFAPWMAGPVFVEW